MPIRHLARTAAAVSVFCACFAPGFHPAANAREAIKPSGDAPRAEGWKKVTVLDGLEHPWSLAFLPGGDMLITERPGKLRLVRNGKLVESPIKGTPDVLALGQGGLMEVSPHPKFEQNKLLYLTYSDGTEEKNRTTLGRGKLEGMELTDFKVLFQVDPPKSGGQHFGSRLLWLPDGTFLMSIGDGGNPPLKVQGRLSREHAQLLSTHLGSLIRLNDDGSVPKDNPFAGREEAKPEIYSYGHRNIQGLARDPRSGRIWANEHGPFGGDELNLIKAGENYGWPEATYGRDYRTKEPVSPDKTLPGMVAPKVVWTPAQAPSGLAFYTGDRFPGWKGDLFSGGLVPKEVRRIKLDGEKVTGEESLPIGRRVRDVVQGPDGFLYVLTDHEDGELLRIEPR